MKSHEEILEGVLSALEVADEREAEYFRPTTPITPSRKEVISIVKSIQSLMFPEYFVIPSQKKLARTAVLEDIFFKLKRQITAAFAFAGEEMTKDTESLAYELLGLIPKIKESLIKDIQAIYEGDPAARSPEEVILSYPGFYAISIYRIAHELYIRNIPYLARLMTEFAHEKTGIDIHAGATIGEYFFIDHGTGIVIGETATIGNRVKLYQGVTLGAKSFELDEDGNPVKGTKRHPDIGNGVVIYAGATILGGRTKIGDGAVIGGNVWLTSSVEPGKTIYYERNTK